MRQRLMDMSMIDPKGARPSGLANIAKLRRNGNLKPEERDDAEKRQFPKIDPGAPDINAA